MSESWPSGLSGWVCLMMYPCRSDGARGKEMVQSVMDISGREYDNSPGGGRWIEKKGTCRNSLSIRMRKQVNLYRIVMT